MDSAIAHHCGQPFVPEMRSGRVEIEEPYLIDDCRPNESCRFCELRADLHAQATGHAARQGVGLLLYRRVDARAGTEVIGPIEGNPGLHLLQVLKEHAAIYSQVAYDRES